MSVYTALALYSLSCEIFGYIKKKKRMRKKDEEVKEEEVAH